MASHRPRTVPKFIIYGFFGLGLLSAVAFRAIIVFAHLDPRWVRPVWYVGTAGYVFFFVYRYGITRKRKRAVEEFRLIEKLRSNACLEEDDREAVLYLLSSIKSSPEDVNYAIIFLLSVAAIAADLLLSAMR